MSHLIVPLIRDTFPGHLFRDTSNPINTRVSAKSGVSRKFRGGTLFRDASNPVTTGCPVSRKFHSLNGESQLTGHSPIGGDFWDAKQAFLSALK